MAIDTPARLAILGAGPLGLEAALYARFLGYDVELLEPDDVGGEVRRQPHLRSFAPFAAQHSPLGLAAVVAQEERYQPPRDDEYLTGGEWLERYLMPLASTDLLADLIRTRTRIVAAGRAGCLKGDLLPSEQDDPDAVERGDYALRLLMVDGEGRERIADFDGVIDALGNRGRPNFLGESGIPALGERAARQRPDAPLIYVVPDVLGAQREQYAGRHTLVIGAGDSAASTLEQLSKLAILAPETRVTWITRHMPLDGEPPLARLTNDPWPRRDALRAAIVGHLAPAGAIEYWPGNAVHSLAVDEATGGWQVELLGTRAGVWPFDRIVANVGWQADHDFTRELHVTINAANDSVFTDGRRGVSSEPHYHVLGGKRTGRRAPATFQDGLVQIRELFALLGDRPTLDLYHGAIRLP